MTGSGTAVAAPVGAYTISVATTVRKTAPAPPEVDGVVTRSGSTATLTAAGTASVSASLSSQRVSTAASTAVSLCSPSRRRPACDRLARGDAGVGVGCHCEYTADAV
jgi:hypothetical protein